MKNEEQHKDFIRVGVMKGRGWVNDDRRVMSKTSSDCCLDSRKLMRVGNKQAESIKRDRLGTRKNGQTRETIEPD